MSVQLYIPTSNLSGFLFFNIPASIYHLSFYYSHSNSSVMVSHIVALICISQMINDIENLLMCPLIIHIFSLVKCLFKSFAYFEIVFCFITTEFKKFVVYSGYNTFISCNLQIFIQFTTSFHSYHGVFWSTYNLLLFMRSSLPTFCFVDHDFFVVSKKWMPYQGLKDFLLCLLQSFIVLAFMFRSLIHSEVIFVYGMR